LPFISLFRPGKVSHLSQRYKQQVSKTYITLNGKCQKSLAFMLCLPPNFRASGRSFQLERVCRKLARPMGQKKWPKRDSFATNSERSRRTEAELKAWNLGPRVSSPKCQVPTLDCRVLSPEASSIWQPGQQNRRGWPRGRVGMSSFQDLDFRFVSIRCDSAALSVRFRLSTRCTRCDQSFEVPAGQDSHQLPPTCWVICI